MQTPGKPSPLHRDGEHQLAGKKTHSEFTATNPPSPINLTPFYTDWLLRYTTTLNGRNGAASPQAKDRRHRENDRRNNGDGSEEMDNQAVGDDDGLPYGEVLNEVGTVN